jgi:hypothetical protein
LAPVFDGPTITGLSAQEQAIDSHDLGMTAFFISAPLLLSFKPNPAAKYRLGWQHRPETLRND